MTIFIGMYVILVRIVDVSFVCPFVLISLFPLDVLNGLCHSLTTYCTTHLSSDLCIQQSSSNLLIQQMKNKDSGSHAHFRVHKLQKWINSPFRTWAFGREMEIIIVDIWIKIWMILFEYKFRGEVRLVTIR